MPETGSCTICDNVFPHAMLYLPLAIDRSDMVMCEHCIAHISVVRIEKQHAEMVLTRNKAAAAQFAWDGGDSTEARAKRGQDE